MEMKAWYIFYTYPRAEKKAYNMLVSSGYEVFLPLNQQIQHWKNRQKKLISKPIFPNYIFVRTNRSSIYNISRNPKIVRCITCGSVPSTISSKEIDWIKEMLESGNCISLENDLSSGQSVKIIHGPLEGLEGYIFSKKGSHKIAIHINSIPFNLSVEVGADCAELFTKA